MNVPEDLSPREAAHALEALARAMEAHLIERGAPSSVAFIDAQIAGVNAWRGARGLPTVLPWLHKPPVERPRLRLVETVTA